MMNRRQALATTFLSGAALSVLSPSFAADPKPAAQPASNGGGPFTLAPLGYGFDALEPHIDAETMQLHYEKHHRSYVTKLNEALTADGGDYSKKTIEELLTTLPTLSETLRKAVRNQGGGHYNHTLFWKMLKKDGGEPSRELAAQISATFGSVGEFWKKFKEAGVKQFGSGWAWLVVGKDKKLEIISTPNQNSPISEGQTEILGLDVWEHAYYLKYRNKRDDYISAFPIIVNWEFVNERYAKAMA